MNFWCENRRKAGGESDRRQTKRRTDGQADRRTNGRADRRTRRDGRDEREEREASHCDSLAVCQRVTDGWIRFLLPPRLFLSLPRACLLSFFPCLFRFPRFLPAYIPRFLLLSEATGFESLILNPYSRDTRRWFTTSSSDDPDFSDRSGGSRFKPRRISLLFEGKDDYKIFLG